MKILPSHQKILSGMSHSERGFTLLEVLVTIVILTIGLLGTAGLTTGVIRGNAYSKNITSATAIAQAQLDAAKSYGYTNVTTTNFPSSATTVNMSGNSFTRTTTITNDSPASNMKTIAVQVAWNESGGTSRTITLSTIMAQ
jgi:type IV pilus modification protein PilV